MTSSTGTAVVTLPTDEQILITREFNAPKRLVYRAWTTPDLVKRWWSGRRGTMTSVEIDLRVGGRWRYVMAVGSGGGEIAFHGEFREIVPEEKIVTTEVFEMAGVTDADEGAPLNTVTFSERDGRTTLTLLTHCDNKQLRDMILESGMEAGMQEQMDLLEELAISLR
ncbi:SRPBCC family protein [Nocardia iowensis]|uniref:SRPBCC family protein n=1 Tax=Nocardia iowensis TaxID=204891 RepID=A0ABX8RYP4_NOCIO|nr:SRPBCC family protein [Nocardia iowensis]QXN94406.1 SRPBCC family protein [Nocardia iowensis]